MKKSIVFLIIAMLMLVPVVSAGITGSATNDESYAQTYSGFERFSDSVKLFFAYGDAKVALALQIRVKEVNSAVNNIQNENEEEAIKNLERARQKLQIVQEKVSYEIADKVKANVEEVEAGIEEYKDSSDNFAVYALEEEKTKLTAELVIEVEGKEGQTLKREVVKNVKTGEKFVNITIEGEPGEAQNYVEVVVEEEGGQRVVKIQGELAQIQNQIVERVVKIEKAEMEKSAEMQNKVDTDVKTGGGVDNDKSPGPQGIVGNQGDGSQGDTVDDTYDDADIIGESCGDGVVCGGDDDVIEGGTGTEGTNDVSPAVDSNEGDDSSSVSGSVIRHLW